MIGQSLTYQIEDVIARLHELSRDGIAPSLRDYNRLRGPGLPSTATLGLHGHTWPQLVERAGLQFAKRGAQPGNRNAAAHSARFEAIDAEVRHRMATAEPPRPSSWPLFGIPTRTETRFGQLPDGTPVRVTRQYYSLR